MGIVSSFGNSLLDSVHGGERGFSFQARRAFDPFCLQLLSCDENGFVLIFDVIEHQAEFLTAANQKRLETRARLSWICRQLEETAQRGSQAAALQDCGEER
mmetsp:Transcript_33023/g.66245  ORF Transcript_33023/g.66245 Transcript_33023/m.66245 type:complete len:101 (-) Transcript_33023:105-407(-)